jgi:hypothetical protein
LHIRLTWRLPVVAELGNEESLGIDDHDPVRLDVVLEVRQRVDLLRLRIVQVAWELDIAEVDLIFTDNFKVKSDV